MAPSRPYTTEHTLTVDAPPRALYDLVADVTRWPAVFGPCVHVQHLERGDREERFEIWARVGESTSSWTSRRRLDPEALRVTFAQEVSRAPIATMSGEWQFLELGDGRTELVLLHTFTAVDDDPAAVRWITEALDANSTAELAAIAAVASGGHAVEDVVFSFTDTLRLPGRAADAYEFVHRADRWADALPHVARVELTETADGVQDLRMDTVTADGSAHSTRSTRICADGAWIAYKQHLMPKLLLGHSGRWTFTEDADGALATATHTVRLDPAAVEGVLGAGRTLADARAYVRDALGRNSLATLSHAAAYAGARG
ncbi:aromatase/cyclase [Kitasatospora sp. NPDC059571]|uniref:aromatase/cyclase n=1 Tax=Kitasatospora sp. NPDC059571 TaxID=3346871 RepID=UPI0036A0154C